MSNIYSGELHDLGSMIQKIKKLETHDSAPCIGFF